MKRIRLTKDRFTNVDDDNFDQLSRQSWSLHHGYAGKVDEQGRVQYLHRLLLGVGSAEYVHHRDGDPLNNQLENLMVKEIES